MNNHNDGDTITPMERLYTLEEAAALHGFPVQAVTLRKYANAGMIGVKIGPEPLPGRADRRPWYVTEDDVTMVRSMPWTAHKAGRPRLKS